MEISSILQNALLNTGISAPSKTLNDLPEALGIVMKTVDFNIPSVIGTIIFREDAEIPTILIKKSAPEELQRFVLAHELGHYLLHKNEVNYFVDSADFTGFDPSRLLKENEANCLAALYLVPQNYLTQLLRAGLTSDEIAKGLKISTTVVDLRIEIENLIN